MNHGTRIWIIGIAALNLLSAAETAKPAQRPLEVKLGLLRFRPRGFIDLIGETRSATTADSVSTKFGRIPLSDTPSESLGTARHSRLMLKTELPLARIKFDSYLESDFMNFNAGESPYRWRQYWARARVAGFEVLGGQAWSLLRPSRAGIDVEKDILHTEVIDPNYHVGLTGSRRRQVRLARSFGNFRAAVAWEGAGLTIAKLARDAGRHHVELTAFTGTHGRRGVSVSATENLTPRFRLMGQQFVARRAVSEALGVAPAGISGASTLGGIEAQASRNAQVYSYAGFVYAARSGSNRLVRQWTAGYNHRVPIPMPLSALMLSVQYSLLDRQPWSGGRGSMQYLETRLRYTFN